MSEHRVINVDRILLKRGTTAQNQAYTGRTGELIMDTDANTVRLHDGTTQGGHVLGSSNFDGQYSSLTGTPTIPADVSDLTDTTNLLAHNTFDGDYNSLTNKPTLFDGQYSSLTGTPTIPADVSDLTDTTNLLVHFSGAYADLTGKPTIPSTGNFTLSNNTITTSSGDTGIDLAMNGATSDDPPALVNKAWRFVNDGSLEFRSPMNIGAEVDATITSTKVGQWDTAHSWGNHATAGYSTFSGSYDDLSDKPTIPTVPTTVSSFTNDANYVASNTTGITGADQVTNIVTLTQAEYDAIGTPNASTVYIIVG